MPRSAFGSFPLRLYVIVVGAPSEACSKVTVPLTVESPRTTATVFRNDHVSIATVYGLKVECRERSALGRKGGRDLGELHPSW